MGLVDREHKGIVFMYEVRDHLQKTETGAWASFVKDLNLAMGSMKEDLLSAIVAQICVIIYRIKMIC